MIGLRLSVAFELARKGWTALATALQSLRGITDLA